MKFKKVTAFLLCPFLFLLTACQAEPQTENDGSYQPITVFGTSFDEEPLKVASLSPALTNLMITLDLDGKLIAKTDACSEAVGAVSIGDEKDPDITSLITMKPDLVLSRQPLSVATLDRLTAADVKVIVIPEPTDLRELKNYTCALASVFFGVDAAVQKTDLAFLPLSAAVHTLYTVTKEDPVTFAFLKDTGSDALGEDTYAGNLLNCLGDNLAVSGKDPSLTAIRKANPEAILVYEPYQQANFTANKLWKGIAAVINGNFVSVPPTAFDGTPFNVADYLLKLGKTFYPEMAESIDKIYLEKLAEETPAAKVE